MQDRPTRGEKLMNGRRYLFLAPAVGAVLALSACSGSGGTTSAGSGSSGATSGGGTSAAAGAPTPDPARPAAMETYLRRLRQNGAGRPAPPPPPGRALPA